MQGKLKDIQSGSQKEKIDLRKPKDLELLKKAEILKKSKNIFYKNSPTVKEVKDLSGSDKTSYSYIKGKAYAPPKFLGNIIKIGIFGFLIIFALNSISIYFRGKSLEKEISNIAYEGISYLVDAGKSATKIQFETALETFDKALENFGQAQDDLWFISKDKTLYASDNNTGKAVESLLESGKHFAIAGKYFTEGLDEFNKIPVFFVSKNNPETKQKISITDILKKGLDKTEMALKEISQATEKIKNTDETSLPSEIGSRISLAKQKINEVSDVLKMTSESFPALLKLLGDKKLHRYLILLQNNNEIRATGGFIGSYAIVEIKDGYIEKMDVQDVYDIDGSYKEIIEPPEELKFFTTNWRFRDSNYSPDFRVAAAKAKWFLETEGGPQIDTVIAINQGLLKDMLEISGPVQVGNFGKLDSGNYNLLLSFIIESKYWGAEDPKHILKVFIPEFKKQIMKEENVGKLMSKLYKAVQQKHIMAYSADSDIEALFQSFGLSGEMNKPSKDEDYLSIINTSVGGTKSDQFIEEKIYHNTMIDKSGTIIDELNIKRTHLWDDSIYYQWKKTLESYGIARMPDQVIDILGRGRNKTLMRIFVPNGTILLDSKGAEIQTKYDKDVKKTYFIFQMEVKAGESKEVNIKYQMPFRLDFSPMATYKLYVDKQPGSRGSILTKEINGNEIHNLEFYPQDAKSSTNKEINYETNLVYDRYFSSIWEK
jgi:tetratricopeptide (TPR) repeat protein